MNLFNLQKAHPSLTIVIARHLLYYVKCTKKYTPLESEKRLQPAKWAL